VNKCSGKLSVAKNLNVRRPAYLVVIYLLLFVQLIKAQVAIGEWRDHLPYSHPISVSAIDDMIVAATSFSLFTFDKSSGELSKFSKIQGLSDTKLSLAKYSPDNDLLLVAYENGNLDLVQKNKVFNLSDIYRAAISGNKRINNVLFVGKLAYLSCDFGIVVLNLEKREFKETYYIGEGGSVLKVYETALQGSNLLAATELGLMTADINDPLIVDYSHWQQVAGIPGGNGSINSVVTINDQLLINRTNTLNEIDSVFVYEDPSWSFLTHNNGKIRSISSGSHGITINGNGKILIYDANLIFQTEVSQYIQGAPQPWSSIFDGSGELWIADHEYGLFRSGDLITFDYVTPAGPYTENAYSLLQKENTLFVAGGGLTDIWSNRWVFGEIFKFTEGSWINRIVLEVKDIINIVPVPGDPDHIYASTWGEGVIELSGNELINKYKTSNSSLQSLQSNPQIVRTCGLLFDEFQNLWVTNTGVNDPVSILSPAGSWTSLHLNGLISNYIIGPIYETENRDKWITIPLNSRLLVINDAQTPEYEADDSRRLVHVSDNEGRNFNRINSLTQDHDGTLWLGTNLGPVVLYNPEDVLAGGEAAVQRIKVPRNDGSGLADYLLSTEDISSIVVDGANRKWIGTKASGIFLQSADGIKTIKSFNMANSPLPSNWITSIAIDPKTGEVFIGTDKGIISYRGDATAGVASMTDVYAFPNPVRGNYKGPVTITGLVSGASVKITDISGNLVFETRALGGQAIWDGNTSFGKRAGTGVYLVFITNDDGSETYITKILFIH